MLSVGLAFRSGVDKLSIRGIRSLRAESSRSCLGRQEHWLPSQVPAQGLSAMG